MRILVDVYDPTGSTRLGEGPVLTCDSATVSRRLDGQGRLKLSGSLTDKRAGDLLQNERVVRVWLDTEAGMREFARGVILEIRKSVNASNFTLDIDCADPMDAIARRTVRNGRQYTNATITSIASGLIALVPGWTTSVESGIASNLHSARFTGTNVFKALLRLAEERGYHLRSGLANNQVEIGVFGADSGLTLTNLQGLGEGVLSNPDVLLIESLEVMENTRGVVNWVTGFGAGEGAAALTLRDSTRTTPYTINTVTDNGQTLYYLEDAASIATYGQNEKTVVFKTIAPVANSSTAKIAAANALYDAMAAYLQRSKDPQITYKVRGVKITQTIRPGDKIRLWYNGTVQRDGQEYTYLEVDNTFWVLEVNERASDSGVMVDLVISTVDQMEQNAAEVVVGALEDIQTQSVAIKTFPYWSENTWTEPVSQDGTNNATAVFKLEFDEAVTDIVRVVIRFKTFPLYVLSQFDSLFRASGAAFSYAYKVYRSTHHPKGLQLWVNGVDVSSSYGGPWNNSATANAALNVECDITDLILANGLYNDHDITFVASIIGSGTNYVQGFTGTFTPGATSSGFIQLNARVLGIAQAILP
jgi:hypothetical protein